MSAQQLLGMTLSPIFVWLRKRWLKSRRASLMRNLDVSHANVVDEWLLQKALSRELALVESALNSLK